ncbi:MAG: hypothetical protein R3B09_08315 [Nannocystaceae bacterium]
MVRPRPRARWRPPLALVMALGVVPHVLACGVDAPKTQVILESPAPPRTGKALPRKPTSKYPQVSACPERLEGVERVDRVIKRECDRVIVAPGYRLDAGSFTVEPGVILAFEPGAELSLGFADVTRVEISGAAGAPVVLTGTADVPGPGAWGGIRLYRGAAGAMLRDVILDRVGDPDRGALWTEADGVVVERTQIREVAGLAVYVAGKGSLRTYVGNVIEGHRGPTVMFLPASSMGAIGEDNVFPAGGSIRLLGDVLRGEYRWPAPGVPVVVAGRIEIAGSAEAPASVTLASGLELHFDPGGYINVGYYDPGVLIAEGTAERPVLFTAHVGEGASAGPGAWRGVNLYKHASASFTHAIFEHGGRYVDRGVLYANSEAEVALRGCTFRDNRAGVVLARDAIRLRDFTNNHFEATPRPLSIDPAVFGDVGDGNDFGGEPILMSEGRVERSATWRDPGALIEVDGPIAVNGATLSIAAGVKLRVRDGFSLEIGRRSPATLLAEGEAGRPIEVVGVHDKRGTWDAIILYPGSRGNVLRHLDLVNAGGIAAVDVRAGASADVQAVSCSRCFSPALTWECGAEVEERGLLLAGGTPSEVLRPTCGA